MAPCEFAENPFIDRPKLTECDGKKCISSASTLPKTEFELHSILKNEKNESFSHRMKKRMSREKKIAEIHLVNALSNREAKKIEKSKQTNRKGLPVASECNVYSIALFCFFFAYSKQCFFAYIENEFLRERDSSLLPFSLLLSIKPLNGIFG